MQRTSIQSGGSGRRQQQQQQPHALLTRPPSSSSLLLRGGGGGGSGAPAATATTTTTTAPAPRRRALVAQATASSSSPSSPPLLLLTAGTSLDSVRDRLLRDELPKMFDPSNRHPLSPDLYAESLVFADPLASFAGFPLYSLNIAAIRALFDVELVTHAAVVREAESSIVTRWTMTLAPKGLPERGLPFLTGRVRRPSVALTGTSAYGVDRATGRVVSHVDTWDSLPMRRQSDALLRGARAPAGASALGGDGARGGGGLGSDDDDDESPSRALLLPPRPRGLLHVARRALRSALALTPDLATPSYGVLFAAPRYEVRRYGPFALAETAMPPGASAAGGQGFNELAGYIFGGNDEGKKWEMTTPVLSDSGGGGEKGEGEGGSRATMAFVIDEEGAGEAEGGGGVGGGGDEAASASTTFATPKDPSVRTRVESGGRLWASIPVRGWPLQRDVRRAERALRAAMARDGVVRATTPPGQYRLLRYNDPFTPPGLRRSELLVACEFCAGGGGGSRENQEAAWAEALLRQK